MRRRDQKRRKRKGGRIRRRKVSGREGPWTVGVLRHRKSKCQIIYDSPVGFVGGRRKGRTQTRGGSDTLG